MSPAELCPAICCYVGYSFYARVVLREVRYMKRKTKILLFELINYAGKTVI
jgi:hypothetical protein